MRKMKNERKREIKRVEVTEEQEVSEVKEARGLVEEIEIEIESSKKEEVEVEVIPETEI